VTVPFSPVEGEFRAQQIAIDPDGTAYVVPSGMHERLRQAVASDREERDPKVALALSGWICLQTSGMTDRINVDALTHSPTRPRFVGSHGLTTRDQSLSLGIRVARFVGRLPPPSSRLQARLKNRSERPIVLSVYLNPHFYVAQYELLIQKTWSLRNADRASLQHKLRSPSELPQPNPAVGPRARCSLQQPYCSVG